MKRIINKVAVLGSGIMGSRIACHFANKGVQVLLLDIVPRELTDAEIKELNQLIEPSSKTEEASLPKSEPTRRKIEFPRRDDSKFRR